MRLQSRGQEKDWNQGEPDSLVKKNVNVFNKCKVEVLVLNLTLYLYYIYIYIYYICLVVSDHNISFHSCPGKASFIYKCMDFKS